MAALVAVAVVVLLLTAVGVFLVVGGDDDDSAGSTTTSSTTSTETASTTTETTETTASTPTTPDPTDPTTSTQAPTVPSVPGSTAALPEGFPDPPGATPSVTGGIDVPGTVDEVAAFYEANLPPAGYTIGSGFDVGVGRSFEVTGPGVDGQLLLVDFTTGTVSVIWTAT